METSGQRTILYDEHLALGGRMVTFAGWELPVQYEAGPLAEHRAVREAAGLFDIDHMGQLRVTGPGTDAFLNAVLTVDVRRVPRWGAQYALLPYADGGLVDDVFLYRLDDAWWVVVNAANREKDLRWLRAQAKGFDVDLADISADTAMLALQGPRAQAILHRVTDIDLAALPFHACARGRIADAPALIGATGYTGEYGYELYVPVEQAVAVWRALLAAGEADGLLPAGLAARDSLRFEAALPLYGHEIGPEIDPFTARLGTFVDFVKGPFVGHEALLKIALEGSAFKLVGLTLRDPAVPREGYPVQTHGETVGRLTTGMKGLTVGQVLALALVRTPCAAEGTELDVLVREQPKRAVVTKLPFYTPAYRRKATA